MSSDLSSSKHVAVIMCKTNKVLGLITRIVGNKNRHVYSVLINHWFAQFWNMHVQYGIHTW